MSDKAKKKPTLVNLNSVQREWLKSESDRTGEPMTSIIRQAIQKLIDSKQGE